MSLRLVFRHLLIVSLLVFSLSMARAENDALKPPPQVRIKYLPLDIDNTQSSSDCRFLLGSGLALYGGKFERQGYDGGLGVIVKPATENKVFLNPHFDQNSYVVGFDPEGTIALVHEGIGVRRPYKSKLYKFNLTTLKKTLLTGKNGRLVNSFSREALSRNKRFLVGFEPLEVTRQYIVLIWDLKSTDSSAREFVVDSPQEHLEAVYDPMISDSGDVIVVAGSKKPKDGYTEGFTQIWRKNGESLKLDGRPMFLSPNGSLVLTRISNTEYKLFSLDETMPKEIPLKGLKEVLAGFFKAHGPSEMLDNDVRIRSSQGSSDGRWLAVEFEFPQLIEGDFSEKVTYATYGSGHALVVWDLSQPQKQPLVVQEKLQGLNNIAYRLDDSGKLLVAGADLEDLLFLNPHTGKSMSVRYKEHISQDYNYNRGVEISNDMQTIAVATEYGVLVIDLSEYVRK